MIYYYYYRKIINTYLHVDFALGPLIVIIIVMSEYSLFNIIIKPVSKKPVFGGCMKIKKNNKSFLSIK